MPVSRLLCLLRRRRELRSHERWSREELVWFQGAALARLRRHAYANSPFYREFHEGLREAPLDQLPVLSKATLMEHWDDVVTDRSLRLAEVQAFVRDLREVRKFRDTYYVCSTAGSSGLKGIFVYDRDEWCSVLASYARANEWAGVRAGVTKRLRLAVVSTTRPWHQSAVVGATLRSWFVPTLRLDAAAPIDQTVAALNAFRPEALVAYAVTAGRLATEAVAGRLRIAPRAVFCSSEPLTAATAELVESAWGVRPVNVYAATETAGLASGRVGRRGLHLYEDLVIAEPVDGSNRPVEIGEPAAKVLVTVLFSRTLPLIRYELSDGVRLLEGPEGWRPFGVIEDVRGRLEETLRLGARSGGTVEVPPWVVHDLLEYPGVRGWQVRQAARDRVTISVLAPFPDADRADLARTVAAELERRGAERPVVEVEAVGDLPRGAIGKTPLITALR